MDDPSDTKDVIKNLTHQDKRRIDLTFGITYDQDIDVVEALLHQILKDEEMNDLGQIVTNKPYLFIGSNALSSYTFIIIFTSDCIASASECTNFHYTVRYA